MSRVLQRQQMDMYVYTILFEEQITLPVNFSEFQLMFLPRLRSGSQENVPVPAINLPFWIYEMHFW